MRINNINILILLGVLLGNCSRATTGETININKQECINEKLNSNSLRLDSIALISKVDSVSLEFNSSNVYEYNRFFLTHEFENAKRSSNINYYNSSNVVEAKELEKHLDYLHKLSVSEQGNRIIFRVDILVIDISIEGNFKNSFEYLTALKKMVVLNYSECDGSVQKEDIEDK